MEAARFIWWMAAAALVLPFLDAVPGLFRGTTWVARQTRVRVVLAVLELGAIAGWLAVRGRWRFLPEPDAAVALAGAVLALTGALFSAWARARLGRLFSPNLGVQEGHRLITTGPYAVVRHPIYLGIIDFIVGSALFWNDVTLLILALLFVVFFGVQLRVEERLFAAHFGDAWERYRSTVPALFPRVIRRPRG